METLPCCPHGHFLGEKESRKVRSEEANLQLMQNWSG